MSLLQSHEDHVMRTAERAHLIVLVQAYKRHWGLSGVAVTCAYESAAVVSRGISVQRHKFACHLITNYRIDPCVPGPRLTSAFASRP